MNRQRHTVFSTWTDEYKEYLKTCKGMPMSWTEFKRERAKLQARMDDMAEQEVVLQLTLNAMVA